MLKPRNDKIFNPSLALGRVNIPKTHVVTTVVFSRDKNNQEDKYVVVVLLPGWNIISTKITCLKKGKERAPNSHLFHIYYTFQKAVVYILTLKKCSCVLLALGSRIQSYLVLSRAWTIKNNSGLSLLAAR